ncbi:MAG: DNA repair protein RadA [Pseudomonadota bacterium]
MTKQDKKIFECTECGRSQSKWAGQCTDCQAWNTLVETVLVAKTPASRQSGYAGTRGAVMPIGQVAVQQQMHIQTLFSELNRVLGGGLVPGAVILVGGDPGVGKSTLLLQVVADCAKAHTVLYVTGEESPSQVSLRANRLKIENPAHLLLLAETEVMRICQAAQEAKAEVMVIDSIQTTYWSEISAAPGGVSQVRECAAILAQYAKQNNTTLFLVGHVTKSGEVAGPRVLEHIVDTVIYMEGRDDGRYRMMRAVKNRFGPINELAVFAMNETGMHQVANPSALFLSRPNFDVPGSAVTSIWEGTRPLLIEIQALVDESHMPAPRRVTVGVDHNRLSMLLAVLHRHAGVFTHNQDVYVNVVGGIRINETGTDLAILAAVISSLKNKPLPGKTLFLGEIGLSGEVRPVANGQERMKEAQKHGFTQAIVASANAPAKPMAGMKVIPIQHVQELTNQLSF